MTSQRSDAQRCLRPSVYDDAADLRIRRDERREDPAPQMDSRRVLDCRAPMLASLQHDRNAGDRRSHRAKYDVRVVAQRLASERANRMAGRRRTRAAARRERIRLYLLAAWPWPATVRQAHTDLGPVPGANLRG
jgi:hypothetical protein